LTERLSASHEGLCYTKLLRNKCILQPSPIWKSVFVTVRTKATTPSKSGISHYNPLCNIFLHAPI